MMSEERKFVRKLMNGDIENVGYLVTNRGVEFWGVADSDIMNYKFVTTRVGSSFKGPVTYFTYIFNKKDSRRFIKSRIRERMSKLKKESQYLKNLLISELTTLDSST